jgi:sugar transport system substrate-binding protein
MQGRQTLPRAVPATKGYLVGANQARAGEVILLSSRVNVERSVRAQAHLIGLWMYLAAMLGLLAGCTKAEKGGSSRHKVAAVLMAQDQFFRLNEFGMKDAADRLKVELLVGVADDKPDKEISLIDTYIEQRVNAILVSPFSAVGSIEALKRASAEGIKIVAYNLSIDKGFESANIESNQFDLGASTGRAFAKYVRARLGGKAKIALIGFASHLPEQGGARLKGFQSILKDLPGVSVVAEQDAWEAGRAATAMESVLLAHPDIDAVWAANEGGTVGAVTAVRSTGKAGKVAVFGTDMSQQLADFLLADDDVLKAVTGQQPFEMGSLAVETAVKVLDGQPVEKKLLLPGILFTREEPEAVRTYQRRLVELTK